MPKSAALIKNETLAQIGNRLESLPRMIALAKVSIATGIPANEAQNTPALTAEEVRSLLNADTIALIESLPV
jgi:hypothetical protein